MKKSQLLTFTLIVFFIGSCSKRKTATVEKSDYFKELVQAYTSGIVSVADEITIRFNADIPEARQGDVLEKDVLTLHPSVPGTTFWLDARTLAFKPKVWLEPGKPYVCTVDAGVFFKDIPKDQSLLKFEFQTKKQDMSVKIGSLVSQEAYYRLEGTVLLADVAKNDDVEKSVRISDEALTSKIRWQHFGEGKHLFYVDSIPRAVESKTFNVAYNGASLGVDSKDEIAVDIPGLNTFKVIRTVVEQEPAQLLRVEFSDQLDLAQDLSGLVRLENETGVSIKKENNALLLIPSQRINGERKINLSGNIRNNSGYRLSADMELTVNFEAIKPNVRFLQSGVIIPKADKGITVPFQTVNLSAVDLYIIQVFEQNIPFFLQRNQLDGENDLSSFGRLVLKKTINLMEGRVLDAGSWNNFSIDLRELIQTEPGAIYRVEFRFKQAYSLYPCGETAKDEELTEDLQEDLNAVWDKGRYWPQWEYLPGYSWSQRDNPCHISYFQNRWVFRNVMVSNLGLTIKTNGQNGYRAFVTDLLTARPLSGTLVTFYNHQNQKMGSAHTNNDGIAGVDLDGMPWLAVAQRDKEKTYLRVDDGSALSYASFDVSGTSVKEGLNGFFYGERGVWRPGDTIHLVFVVNDTENPLPDKQPATLYFYNPESKLVQKIVNTSPTGKFYKYTLLTNETDPTGNWLAKVSIGGASFTKSIKIETIKPNRLKIDMKFSDEVLDASKPIKGSLNVKWLHGAVGKNLKVKADVNFKSKPTSFDHLPGFVFNDPVKTLDMREETVFEGSTNATGDAAFSFNKSLSRFAPAMLRAVFTLKAFEPGGEFSITQLSKDYSPFDTYIGVRLPEKPKNSWHYNSGQEYNVDVVSVDMNGKPKDMDHLQVEVYKLEWEWWWNSGSNNLAYYIQRNHNRPVLSKTIYTKEGKGRFKLSIDKNSWGRYLVRVIDPNGHSTGQITYFDWPWRKSSEGAGGATRLAFNTDKESYTKGETVTVNIPGEKGARALVSVEAGTRILQNFWVDITEEGGTFQIEATEDMAPNAYINVVLIQPYASTINENPLRLYGVIPVFVEDPDKRLQPEIVLPNSVEPEQVFKVDVKEQNGKPMTYTLAIVDEGLLDITNFKTPDIHGAFFRRKALMVNMWDMFDYVSGAFGGKIEKVFGIGGDDELTDNEKKQDNRFKPVVLYSGPHHLKPGEKTQHTFKMPKYIGSVKAMVIAGADNKYGSSDAVMAVKKPVMVLATLPRVLSPGESVVLPVSVFIMDERIKKANVTIQTNNLFNASDKSRDIEIEETGEHSVAFPLEVADGIGTGEVNVVVETDFGKADYSINIAVRNPNRPVKFSQNRVLEKGEEVTLTTSLPGMKGTNSVSLELSSLPPLNIKNRLDFLIRYPYGCIEQTVSSVFPQLYIDNLITPTDDQAGQMRHNIETAINRLTRFQLSDGAFSYWPGNGYVTSWGTSYAVHFLIEAERKGYVLPFGMKEKAVDYMLKQSAGWNRNHKTFYYDMDQAYRLYVLALDGKPDVSGMNRLRQKESLDERTRWRLASAYAAMGKPDVAEGLIDMTKLEIADYEDMSYTYGSKMRDYAMLLETLVGMNKKQEVARILKEFSTVLSDNDRWLSTQTTAWMLMSASKAKDVVVSGNGQMKYSYQIKGKRKTSEKPQNPVELISWQNDEDSVVTIQNNSDGVLFVTLSSQGVPLKDKSSAVEKNIALNVAFFDLNGVVINPESIRQGTDFKAVFSIKYSGLSRSSAMKNLALTQVFPSGWEIINSRLYGEGYRLSGDEPDYQDIRDDRVSMFFDLDPRKEKRFEVLLNAAYEGEYILPAAVVEAMYSNAYYARSKSKTVSVIKE